MIGIMFELFLAVGLMQSPTVLYRNPEADRWYSAQEVVFVCFSKDPRVEARPCDTINPDGTTNYKTSYSEDKLLIRALTVCNAKVCREQ